MDGERLKITAEVWQIKLGVLFWSLIRIAGICIVIVGAINLFAPVFEMGEYIIPVHQYLPYVGTTDYVVDVGLIAIGGLIVNFA